MAKTNCSTSVKDCIFAYSSHGFADRGGEFHSPNEWFSVRFPTACSLFGFGFVEGQYFDEEKLRRTIITNINEDAWAQALSGEVKQGLRIVFSPPDEKFYFFDHLVEAFVPVAEERIKLLLSNFLITCAESCSLLVDPRPLVEQFRSDSALQRIIGKAKIILEVEPSFFNHHQRFSDGHYIKSPPEPPHRLFAKVALIPDAGAGATVKDSFVAYTNFCSKNGYASIDRATFKSSFAEIIRENFQLGLRNDIMDTEGKQQQGWKGFKIDDSKFATLNLN